MFKFAQDQRFPNLAATGSDVFYSHNSMLSKRGTSFGYGDKSDITRYDLYNSGKASRLLQKDTASSQTLKRVPRKEWRWVIAGKIVSQCRSSTRLLTPLLAPITPSSSRTRAWPWVPNSSSPLCGSAPLLQAQDHVNPHLLRWSWKSRPTRKLHSLEV